MKGGLKQLPWEMPASIQDAKAMQEALSGQVERTGIVSPDEVRWIAGVDASISRDGERMIGCICLLSWPRLVLEDVVITTDRVAFPYVPGYLSFREVPVLLKAAERLQVVPDLTMVDGQGIAHPRRLGLASHFGLVTGWRTLGCAKNRLVGECGEPGNEKGSTSPCMVGEEQVATVVRSRTGVKPLWISTGHGIDPDHAVEWVLACTTRYRLPEPVRAAHRQAAEYRRNEPG